MQKTPTKPNKSQSSTPDLSDSIHPLEASAFSNAQFLMLPKLQNRCARHTEMIAAAFKAVQSTRERIMNNSKSPQTATSLLSVIGLLTILTIPNIGVSQISRSPTRILQEAGNTVTFDNGSIEVVVQRSGNLLITDKGTYHLSSGRSVTPQSSNVAPSASLPVTMSPSARNSSSRQSKSDQLQGELMQSIQMGAILREQGNSERQYQREIDLDKARGGAYATLYAIDPNSPDASDRLRQAAASFESILPASEWRNIFDPVNASVREKKALAEQHKQETGMAVPLDKDGRYDFGAAAQERRELSKAYEGGLQPATLGVINNSPFFQGRSLTERLDVGKQHEKSKRVIEWGLRSGAIDYGDIRSAGQDLYIDRGDVRGYSSKPAGIAVPENETAWSHTGYIYNRTAVMGLPTKDGRNLITAYEESQRATEARASSTAMGTALTSQIENQKKVISAYQYLLNLELNGVTLPEDVKADTTEKLAAATTQLQNLILQSGESNSTDDLIASKSDDYWANATVTSPGTPEPTNAAVIPTDPAYWENATVTRPAQEPPKPATPIQAALKDVQTSGP